MWPLWRWWKETTPSEYGVICWVVILVSFGAALVADQPGMRVLCFAIGAVTLAARVAYVRYLD